MARRIAAIVPDDLAQAAQQFIFWRDENTNAERVKNSKRDVLKGWLTLKNAADKYVNGRVDENGHRYYDFEQPIIINDVTYTGIVAQRKVSASLDLEEVERLLREKDPTGKLYDAVFKRVVTREFDEDALYVLNQRGAVTDGEMESLLVEEESFALTAVKA